MEKIILTEKTVGNIIGRLKNFMENKVFISQSIYDTKVSKVRRAIEYARDEMGAKCSMKSFLMNAKVVRCTWSHGKPNALIHVSIHRDSAMLFYEGDVFYFCGSMMLVDEKSCTLLKSRFSSGRKERVVGKFQLVNSPDAKLIQSIENEYDFEEKMSDAYWKDCEEEMDKELDKLSDEL